VAKSKATIALVDKLEKLCLTVDSLKEGNKKLSKRMHDAETDLQETRQTCKRLAAERDACIESLKDCVKLINDMGKNIKDIVLQDYALYNTAPGRAERCIELYDSRTEYGK